MNSFLMLFLGQRVSLLLVLPFGTAAWITMAKTDSFIIILLSRIILGLALGVAAGCASTYVIEIAHKSVRGRLSALGDVSRQLGYLLIYCLGSSSLSWRTVCIIMSIFIGLPFIGFLFVPNSPRWLATRGRLVEAENALQFFRGKNFDSKLELQEIQGQISKMNKIQKFKISQLFNKVLLGRILILSILIITYHGSGSITINAYIVTLFQVANVSVNPYLCAIIVGIIRVLGTLICLLLMDKTGRKPLFLLSTYLTSIFLLLFGLYFYLKNAILDINVISWLPLTSALLFSLLIAIASPVLKLTRSEMLPNSVRPVAISFLNIVFFASGFVSTFLFPFLMTGIGTGGTFFIFSLSCFTMATSFAIFIPETKKLSLEKTSALSTNAD